MVRTLARRMGRWGWRVRSVWELTEGLMNGFIEELNYEVLLRANSNGELGSEG